MILYHVSSERCACPTQMTLGPLRLGSQFICLEWVVSSLLWVNLFEISLTAQMKKLMAKLGPYPPPPFSLFPVEPWAGCRASFSLTVFSLFPFCVFLSLSLSVSSPFYSLPLVGLPSWAMVFPKMGGPILTYIPDRMGPIAHFWIDLVGTCANL